MKPPKAARLLRKGEAIIQLLVFNYIGCNLLKSALITINFTAAVCRRKFGGDLPIFSGNRPELQDPASIDEDLSTRRVPGEVAANLIQIRARVHDTAPQRHAGCGRARGRRLAACFAGKLVKTSTDGDLFGLHYFHFGYVQELAMPRGYFKKDLPVESTSDCSKLCTGMETFQKVQCLRQNQKSLRLPEAACTWTGLLRNYKPIRQTRGRLARPVHSITPFTRRYKTARLPLFPRGPHHSPSTVPFIFKYSGRRKDSVVIELSKFDTQRKRNRKRRTSIRRSPLTDSRGAHVGSHSDFRRRGSRPLIGGRRRVDSLCRSDVYYRNFHRAPNISLPAAGPGKTNGGTFVFFGSAEANKIRGPCVVTFRVRRMSTFLSYTGGRRAGPGTVSVRVRHRRRVYSVSERDVSARKYIPSTRLSLGPTVDVVSI
ncbi:hypothetical protein EVAR_49784_1 [Eumeta japonica]|uniref:Uncharacterized protein n=1 Tax=Eumeta variegata TaxID=151549 RepID=A0A4C1Y586_EUMVA|nr:hypothetical protein EVAR_49784_1 [Eumeta japonica]